MLTIKSGNKIRVGKGGKLILTGDKACFNYKNFVDVSPGGTLEIGNNFWVNAFAEFHCKKRLRFGDDVLISFHVTFLDSDHHPIFNLQNKKINFDREILIGNNVWIGCNVTILKGALIGNNIVIGAGTLVTEHLLQENTIYCGNPVRIVKNDITWRLYE